MRFIILFIFLLLPTFATAVEVLEVSGKTIKFRTLEYEIPIKKRVLVYSKKKSKKGRPLKLALARITGVEGKIYSAKVIKKYRKEEIKEGYRIRISKKYRIKGNEKKKDGAKKKQDANVENHGFLLKVRPLVVASGYADIEAEFALKGSSKSFGVVFAYIGLESNTQSVGGFGVLGKYTRYFSPKAISKGFFLSGSFGLYILTASGYASNRSKLNVDLYTPYFGGTLGYQIFFKKKWSFAIGGGAGYYLIASEIDTTALTGTSSTMEVPLSGFTPVIDLSFGYSF